MIDAQVGGGGIEMLSLYDLLRPEILANPYPLYHQLRSENPVYWDDLACVWMLTRYVDIVSALSDSRFSAVRMPVVESRLTKEHDAYDSLVNAMSKHLVFMDPPDHTRLRGIVSKAFVPRKVETMRSRVQQVVEGLLDEAQQVGRMDIIHDFARPLPAIVIAEMLGVPAEDRAQFRQWGLDISAFIQNVGLPPDRLASVVRSTSALMDYLRNIIAQHRENPGKDLLDVFIAAEKQGKVLSEEELIGNCAGLLIAGFETTATLIGNSLLTLLKNPDQQQQLKNNPLLIPAAVTELLRYHSPAQLVARVAKQDLEVGGKQVRKGQRAILIIGAANRDPSQFSEPDKLDFSRQENRHIAFGGGLHHCLGASLARIMAEVTINSVLCYLQVMQIEDALPEWEENLMFRIPKSLQVVFSDGVAAGPGEQAFP